MQSRVGLFRMRVGKITDFQQLLGSCVSFRVKALCTNGGKMSQIEELKLFVYERLQTAASEIFGAIEKTVTEYEERASRLKEDNDRHRSLIDIILKTKLPQKQGWSILTASDKCASQH